MNHQQKGNAADKADGMPAFLAVDEPVPIGNGVRICKDSNRRIE